MLVSEKTGIGFAWEDGKIQNIPTYHNCENFVAWEDENVRFGIVVQISQHVLVVAVYGAAMNLDMGLPLTLALYLKVFRQ